MAEEKQLPGDSSGDPIVAALGELTAEVRRLRQAVEAMAGNGAHRAAATAAPVVAVTEALTGALPQAPALEDVEADRVQREVDQVLVGLFMSALDVDSEAGFERFLEVMHTDRTDAPRSIPSLREFNWKSLRKNVGRYLSEPTDGSSFTVVRREPTQLRASDNVVKLFLECPGRSPVPITLKRDRHHEDAWRVTDSSL